jgi:hypothetical protein
MESHPYAKNQGVKMSSNISSSKVSPDVSPADARSEICQHIDARGHRCRMLVMSPNENLCPHHKERLLLIQRGREAATAELVDCLKNHFGDSESIHGFLCTLLRSVTLKRLPRREALTLTYICRAILTANAGGYREAVFERQEERLQALAAAQRPRKVIWDIPHPLYEPDDPVEPDLQNNSR